MFNKVKKTKIKRLNKDGLKIKASSLALGLLSLVLTIIVFAGLLFLQDIVSGEIIYQKVIVAKKDIPEHEIITADNAVEYFTKKDINVLDTTSGYMVTIDDVLGKKAKVNLLEGEIISIKDFEDLSQYSKNFKNPVEVSIDIGSIANADGGKIRTGDVINLTMMFSREQLGKNGELNTVSQINGREGSVSIGALNTITDDYDLDTILREQGYDIDEDEEELLNEESSEEEQEVEEIESNYIYQAPTTISNTSTNNYNYEYYSNYVLENIYVVKALDAAGLEVSPTDPNAVASILVFVIEKEDEEILNNALSNCSDIRVSKQINKSLEKVNIKDLDKAISENSEVITEETIEEIVTEEEE